MRGALQTSGRHSAKHRGNVRHLGAGSLDALLSATKPLLSTLTISRSRTDGRANFVVANSTLALIVGGAIRANGFCGAVVGQTSQRELTAGIHMGSTNISNVATIGSFGTGFKLRDTHFEGIFDAAYIEQNVETFDFGVALHTVIVILTGLGTLLTRSEQTYTALAVIVFAARVEIRSLGVVDAAKLQLRAHFDGRADITLSQTLFVGLAGKTIRGMLTGLKLKLVGSKGSLLLLALHARGTIRSIEAERRAVLAVVAVVVDAVAVTEARLTARTLSNRGTTSCSQLGGGSLLQGTNIVVVVACSTIFVTVALVQATQTDRKDLSRLKLHRLTHTAGTIFVFCAVGSADLALGVASS